MISFNCKSKRLLVTLLFSFEMFNAFSQIPLPACSNPNFSATGECEDLLCRVCNLNGYTGSSAGFGPDPDGDLPGSFCGDSVGCVQNIAFFVAVPDLDITVTASNCTMNKGIDLGLMPTACDMFPLTECVAGDGSNSTTLSLSGINIGPYILIIDVDATGPCDLAISVNPSYGTIPAVPATEDIIGDFTPCPGAVCFYQIDPYYPGSIYGWTAPSDAIVFIPPFQEQIGILWGNTSGEVCVTTQHPCYANSAPFCKYATITPIPPTILPPLKICAEDLPFQLPWGEEASTSGTFSTTISSFQECDSTLIQTVTVLSANNQTLPPVQLCEGGCLTKCGETFCGYGDYTVTCQSYLGCDSVINFSIVPPNLVAEIQGTGSINCSDSTVTLSSELSSGVKTWTNSAGQPLGTGSLLTVNSPGTYFLTVTLMLAGETCAATDSVVIPLNIMLPHVNATGAVLGCDTLPVFVYVDSLPGPESYSWLGPNGFASNLQNPTVTELGMYIVTVVDLANGCSAKDTVLVKSCCTISAGTLDSTMLMVCGEKNLLFNFHGDQILGLGDSLVFILYSDSLNPFGSILLYSDTTIFPFVPGLQQLDSVYYVAAFAGSSLPDTTNSFQNSCWALSAGQPVRWVSKPSITVTQGPELVCKGDCMDLLFQFTGTPPFYFHFEITENGVLMLAQDIVSDTLQKTITICPSAFIQPQGHGTLHFNVNYFQDAICNCND